jgi:hypothetical protein
VLERFKPITYMNLSERILAIAPGDLCRPAIFKIKNINKVEDFLTFYKSGIDFCFNNDFPNAEFLKKEAGGILKENGFYVDVDCKVAEKPTMVVLGKSRLEIVVDNYEVTEIYAKDETEITVIAKANCFVMIDVFDNVKAKITVSENARVTVNVYGNARVTADGIVTINEKHCDKYQ